MGPYDAKPWQHPSSSFRYALYMRSFMTAADLRQIPGTVVAPVIDWSERSHNSHLLAFTIGRVFFKKNHRE